ncbi:MAG TPA: ABC transporter ATP-binding protein [Ramlibacter sp.]|jgi:branched-chain amino acid transport system ATP-binding protein
MSNLLEVRGLNASYGQTQVLSGVDLQVRSGTTTVLLGANGAGKTTTLRAVCAMVKTSGSIRFRDAELTRLPTNRIARLGIAHVPDGRGTFAELSVQENLRLGGITRSARQEVQEDLERVLGYFPRLRERMNQQAGTLSGGEQQMLAIARALMLRPTLLLLDEPSFGLAPLVVAEIYRILSRISADTQLSMLLVEQNAKIALEHGHHGYLLESGRVVLEGPAADLRADDTIRRSYLGQ